MSKREREQNVGTVGEWIRAKLGRTTNSGLFIPEIDGLRTVAILLVILVHLKTFIAGQNAYPHPLSPFESVFQSALTRGSFGVQLFFALSGFIIALPFAQHFIKESPAVDTRKFYLRRLTRLEPPYLINLGVNAVIHFVFDHWPLLFIAEHLAVSSLYLHNVIYGQHSVINLAAWSLEIEFQFYFLAPLFLAVLAIRKPWQRRILIILALLAVIALRPPFWRIEKSLIGKVEYFGAGIILADIFVTEWKSALPRRRLFDLLGAVGWISLGWLLVIPEQPGVMILRPIALFAALTGSVAGSFFSHYLRNPWIVTFGGMCYTVYLYHSTILAIVVRATKGLTLTHSYFVTYALQLLLNLVAIVLISSVLFFFLEKPFMNRRWPELWRQRWRDWRQTQKPQSANAELASP